MLFSQVNHFTDSDQMQAALRAANVELVVTGREVFSASLTRIDLLDLWMQRAKESNARIADVSFDVDRIILFFADGAGPPMLIGGRVLQPEAVSLGRLGQHSFHRTTGPTHWGSLSLTPSAFAETAVRLAGRDITVRPEEAVSPPPLTFARLRRLHRQACALAIEQPGMIGHRETARALEEALARVMVLALSGGAPIEDRSARRRHRLLMSRFSSILASNPDRALHIGEICTALAISEWTLRELCQDQLGLSPKRYLLLRRMHLARRMLTKATAEVATVTGIAMDLGFVELGRFAVAYRHLFGEAPSATLRRPADARDPRRATHRLPALPETA